MRYQFPLHDVAAVLIIIIYIITSVVVVVNVDDSFALSARSLGQHQCPPVRHPFRNQGELDSCRSARFFIALVIIVFAVVVFYDVC